MWRLPLKTKQLLLATVAALFLSTASFKAGSETAAHLITLAPYNTLFAILNPNVPTITTLVKGVKNQRSYGQLVRFARALEHQLPNSQLSIAQSDGTPVFDGSKIDDPGDTLPKGNSYAHFQAKTITENLNTRISFFDAQDHVDGLGAETKSKLAYVAIRLGKHLQSSGTARFAVVK
jgi:hypothetical protein